MAYGDGGFFFTQPVGNGYSGVSYSAPLGLGADARLARMEAELRQVLVQIAKVQRLPNNAAKAGLLQSLQQKAASLRARIAKIKSRQRPRFNLRVPPVSLPYIESPIDQGPALDLSDVQPEVGPMPAGWNVVEDEMTVMDEGLEDEGLLASVQNYIMENPLMSAAIGAGVGYGLFRLYKRYRG